MKLMYIERRIFLSLWGGVTLPSVYLLFIAVLISVCGKQINNETQSWLFLPLRFFEIIYTSIHQSKINNAGDIVGEYVNLVLLIFIGNFILYGVITYFVLWSYCFLKNSLFKKAK